jgi:sensor histidine kinase YesM
MALNMTLKTVKSRHGLGLANARAQLRNLFGAAASLSIASRADGGTRAQIVVDRPAP